MRRLFLALKPIVARHDAHQQRFNGGNQTRREYLFL